MAGLSLQSTELPAASQPMNLRHGKAPSLSSKYHDSEISNNKKIIAAGVIILYGGFGIIIFGIIFAFFEKTNAAILTCASGAIADFISGVILVFAEMSNKSKYQYYNQLSKDEERESLMEAIKECKTEKAREKMLEKLVDNHCKRT